MKQIRKRLTYANVMSSIAVFLVLGGATAFAAGHLGKNTVGTRQLKKNAVTSAKIKKNAVNAAKLKAGSVTGQKLAAGAVSGDKLADSSVSTGKLADSAVATGKLADSSVSTGKLADSAVTTGKLADSAVTTGKISNDAISTGKLAESSVTAAKLQESERSQAFQASVTSGTLGLANGLVGEYGEAQSVVSLTLPAGSFVVIAQTEFINTDVGEDHDAVCRLVDGAATLGEQAATALPGLLFPSAGVTVSGISDGGRVDLACRQGATSKVFAFQRQITALRVGSVG